MEERKNKTIHRIVSASRINRAFQIPIPAVSRHSLSFRIFRAAQSGLDCELPKFDTYESSSRTRSVSHRHPRLFCSGSLEPHISTALRHPVQTQRSNGDRGWEAEAVSRWDVRPWLRGQMVQLSKNIAVSNGASLSASLRGSVEGLNDCRLRCGYDGLANTPSWFKRVPESSSASSQSPVAVHANLLSNFANTKLTLEGSLGEPSSQCLTALLACGHPSSPIMALGNSLRMQERVLLCTRWSREGGRHMWLAQPVWSFKGGDEASLLLTMPPHRSPLACLQFRHKFRSRKGNTGENFVDMKLFLNTHGQMALRFKVQFGEGDEKDSQK